MTEKPTGGSAFPIALSSTVMNYGMTLRDYFAAAALQGFLAQPRATQEWINAYAVKSAWQLADDMLEARRK